MPSFSLPVTTFGDSNVDANQLIELIDNRTDALYDEAAILDPEYWSCEDLDGIPEDDNTEDSDARPSLPPRFQFDENDTRLRPSSPRIRLLSESAREKRSQRFRTRIRIIIAQLKHLVLEFWLHYDNIDDDHFGLFTRGFATLINNADSDFLLDAFLNGVPEETRLVLGKSDFTVDDILSLPRLIDIVLSEKGIYVDMLKGSDTDTWTWKSYVGSASGINGILQRWYDYIGGANPRARTETGRHSRAILVEGRTLNLRCLVHYGHDPMPWLIVFAESIFMIYLGTISDPKFRSDPPSKFVHDKLYDAVDNIRQVCRLDEPLAPGLNSTWSLLQGWRRKHGGRYICQNCGDSAESRAALRLPPPKFISVDPTRPDGSSFNCITCYNHLRTHRVERPLILAARNLARDQHPGKFDEHGWQICEGEGCGIRIDSSKKRSFDHDRNQWKCHKCAARASRLKRGVKVRAAYIPPPGSFQVPPPPPQLCEVEGCNNTASPGLRQCVPCARWQQWLTKRLPELERDAAAQFTVPDVASVPSMPNSYASPYPYVSPYQ